MAKIAERVFKKKTETNYVAEDVFPEGPIQIWAATSPAGGPTPQIFDVMSALQEGVGEFQRKGVKVSPTRHTVDVKLAFNNLRQDITGTGTLDNCAWDITAHVWYGYVRRYKNVVDVTNNAAALMGQMLEDGQGNTLPWDGSAAIDQFKLNTEVFQFKHKAVRMFRPFGSQNVATLAGGQTTYFPQKLQANLKLSFKPPKSLVYDELQGVPQNYAPVIVVAYKHNDYTQGANVYADGPNLLNKPALMMTARSHLYFKDA